MIITFGAFMLRVKTLVLGVTTAAALSIAGAHYVLTRCCAWRLRGADSTYQNHLECAVRKESLRQDSARSLVVPSELDFGTLRADNTSHDYSKTVRIHHRNCKSIKVTKVSTSCGCTAVGIHVPAVIAGGGNLSFPVELTIGPYDNSGPIRREVRLEFGDKRELVLPVRADVKSGPHLSATPGFVDFGTVGEWERPSQQIALAYPSPYDVELRKTVSGTGKTSIICRNPRRQSDGLFVVDLALAPGRRSGPGAERIFFETSKGECFADVRWNKANGPAYCRPRVVVCRSPAEMKTVNLRSPASLQLGHITTSCDSFVVAAWTKRVDVVGDTRIQQIGLALKTQPQRLPYRGQLKFRSDEIGQLASLEVIILDDKSGL